MTSLIHKALVAIGDDLRKEGISKNQECTGGGRFKYRGIDDVYAALSPLLAKHNVSIRPVEIDKEEDSLLQTRSGHLRLVRIRVTYEATHGEDGSCVRFVSLGEGSDTSDKAAGKAMSYAYKSGMFQLFCVPVEGQEDPDQVVHEVEPTAVAIPLPVAARARDLLEAIATMDDLESLNALGAEVGKLNLPKNSSEYKQLSTAFKTRKKELAQ